MTFESDNVVPLLSPSLAMGRVTSTMRVLGSNTDSDHEKIRQTLSVCIPNDQLGDLIITYLSKIPMHYVETASTDHLHIFMPGIYLAIPEQTIKEGGVVLPTRTEQTIQFFTETLMSWLRLHVNETLIECIEVINDGTRTNLLVLDRLIWEKRICTVKLTICSKINCRFCRIGMTPAVSECLFCSVICRRNSCRKRMHNTVTKRIYLKLNYFGMIGVGV